MRLSCLTDSNLSLVADASVIINLNASEHAKSILRALPNRLILTDTVLAELRLDRRNGRDDAKQISELIDDGLATVTALASLRENHFELLVSGRAAETLDDGEAATIACAIEVNAIPLIDERKAITLCASRYPNLTIGRTVDVFTHDAVETAIGRESLAEAVFNTLQFARMRVSIHHEQWVVELIGKERARMCPSLPGRLRVDQRMAYTDDAVK